MLNQDVLDIWTAEKDVNVEVKLLMIKYMSLQSIKVLPTSGKLKIKIIPHHTNQKTNLRLNIIVEVTCKHTTIFKETTKKLQS